MRSALNIVVGPTRDASATSAARAVAGTRSMWATQNPKLFAPAQSNPLHDTNSTSPGGTPSVRSIIA